MARPSALLPAVRCVTSHLTQLHRHSPSLRQHLHAPLSPGSSPSSWLCYARACLSSVVHWFTLLACVLPFLTSWQLTSSSSSSLSLLLSSSSSSSSQPLQHDRLVCSFDQGAELLRGGGACQGCLCRLRLQNSAQPCLSRHRQH